VGAHVLQQMHDLRSVGVQQGLVDGARLALSPEEDAHPEQGREEPCRAEAMSFHPVTLANAHAKGKARFFYGVSHEVGSMPCLFAPSTPMPTESRTAQKPSTASKSGRSMGMRKLSAGCTMRVMKRMLGLTA